MGARINYNIKQPNGLYTVLYSHWGADNAGHKVGKALAVARGRWTDTNYCTRIIISQIIGEDYQGTTNYGIEAATEPNYDDAWLIIDLAKQRVNGPMASLSFDEMVQAQPTVRA